MSETPTAFPLCWPAGWPRTHYQNREHGKFGTMKRRSGPTGGEWKERAEITIAEARDRLQKQLDMLGARQPILSTNLELRLDGLPRSGQKNPQWEPGAAVYFQMQGKPIVLACDNFREVADNIAAIAAHIEALRGMLRWKVGRVEQAFAGYVALPAATPAAPPWWAVLGFQQVPATMAEAEAVWKAKIREAHPDAGGNTERAAALNAAIDEARKILK